VRQPDLAEIYEAVTDIGNAFAAFSENMTT
jgi:hypothetical protein